ncbi:MAG: hypothetical protein U0791_03680 [Gemmataceae bacterium]
MRRVLANLVVFSAGLLLATQSPAIQDDSVRQKLDTAKEVYDGEAKRIRIGILESFDKREESARKESKKKLDAVKAERAAFEDNGELPSAMADWAKKRAAARSRMEKEYSAAVAAYLQAKRDQLAAEVEKAKLQFLESTLVGSEYLRMESDQQLVIAIDRKYYTGDAATSYLPNLKVIDVKGVLVAKQFAERKNVLCSHPVSRGSPGVFNFTKLTAKEKGTLVLRACSAGPPRKTGGGRVVVLVGGKPAVDETIDQGGKWRSFEIPFDKQRVVVEHHPIDWAHEAMFFDYEIK